MKIKGKVMALVLVAAGSTVPAGAEHGSGTITGTVINGAGAPLGEVCVQAYAEEEWEWYREVATTVTGSDGVYTLEVPAYWSPVKIKFGDWCHLVDSEPEVVPEWYDNETDFWSADDVEVGDDATTSGVDAVLEHTGSVSGTVTSVDGGLDCFLVDAYSFDGDWQGSTWSETAEYRVDGLRPGAYALQFRPCSEYWEEEPRAKPSYHDGAYAIEWYDDAISISSATPVTVVSGADTPSIDAELERGGSISGTVTVPDVIEANSVNVSIYSAEGDLIRDAYVEHSGEFTAGPLKAGSYRVHFGGEHIQGEWYDDKPSLAAADPVEVGDEQQTSGVDASLLVRPAPDFAIQGLRIKNVPITTDHGPVGYTGWTRKIEVDLANIGERSSEGFLELSVSTTTDGRNACYADTWLSLRPGQVRTITVDWIAMGSIGDVIVSAYAGADGDRDYRNNVMRDSHYVMAGGTGVGLTALQNRCG